MYVCVSFQRQWSLFHRLAQHFVLKTLKDFGIVLIIEQILNDIGIFFVQTELNLEVGCEVRIT